MRKLIAFLFVSLSTTVTYANPDNILNATCRINNKFTGVVYEETDDAFFILTAGHATNYGKKEAVIEFYITNQSKPMQAEIVLHIYKETTTSDLAIIKLKKTEFGDYPQPKPIPLGDDDSTDILSCGCPSGNWPSLWKGKVTKRVDDQIHFVPKAIAGRSGSGVFNKDGTKIIGMIIWQEGVAVSTAKIHELIGDFKIK